MNIPGFIIQTLTQPQPQGQKGQAPQAGPGTNYMQAPAPGGKSPAAPAGGGGKEGSAGGLDLTSIIKLISGLFG